MRELAPIEIRTLIEDALKRVPAVTMAELARNDPGNRQAALDEITARVQAAFERHSVLAPEGAEADPAPCPPAASLGSARGRLSLKLGG